MPRLIILEGNTGGSKSQFKLGSLISFVHDSNGVDSTTSLLLEVNLWSLKPPFMHISVLFLINSMASGTVGTDLRKSLT